MEEVLAFFICGAVGVISLGGAFFFWKRVNKFLSEALPAEGEVIGFEESNSDGITYAPIVRFVKGDGSIIEFTDSVFSNPPGFKVDERVKIFYHRRNSNDARIAKADLGIANAEIEIQLTAQTLIKSTINLNTTRFQTEYLYIF